VLIHHHPLHSIDRSIDRIDCSGNIGQNVEVVRTGNAVTILAPYPYRHVQVVLRIYKSPAEVIMGFDIDACALAYDGTRVWALPRR
jgi:hypothetical protein